MKLTWDNLGQRTYETGTSKGVLYLLDDEGDYTTAAAWSGLTKVTEKPTGAATTRVYADNINYLTLVSVEMWEGTIEALTYPDAWMVCDGSASPEAGVNIGQQPRESFGFCWRTEIGNDQTPAVASGDYKLHLAYNCLAAPSERDYETINDTPDAIPFSWSITSTAVPIAGYSATSTVTIDSTKVDAAALLALETLLYGTDGAGASLPSPASVVALFAGTATSATPTAPTMTSDVITIPVVTGVNYYIDGALVTGTVTITTNKVVTALPKPGYFFPDEVQTEWEFVHV